MIQNNPDAPRYFIALTLGLNKDHALCVVECSERPETARLYIDQCLSLNYTSTKAIRKAKDSILRSYTRHPSVLVVDATMVGRPIIDRLQDEPQIKSDIHVVRFTAGDTESRHENVWRVPKLDLVSTMNLLQENNRIEYGTGEEALLIEGLKLLTICLKDIEGDHRLAWRDETIDPRVWACALGCWAALHPALNRLS